MNEAGTSAWVGGAGCAGCLVAGLADFDGAGVTSISGVMLVLFMVRRRFGISWHMRAGSVSFCTTPVNDDSN